MFTPQFDREKFKVVVHYIVAHTSPEELGRVKLHKTLYFTDMLRFLSTGNPLTGAEYRKQPFGPCASFLTWALDELEQEGGIKQSRESYYGYEKHRFELLRPPPIERLDDDARALIDETIDVVCRNNTARSISELSHTRAWESVSMGDVMPYHSAVNILPVEIDDDAVNWAIEEAGKLAVTGSGAAPVQRRTYREFRDRLSGDRGAMAARR